MAEMFPRLLWIASSNGPLPGEMSPSFPILWVFCNFRNGFVVCALLTWTELFMSFAFPNRLVEFGINELLVV